VLLTVLWGLTLAAAVVAASLAVAKVGQEASANRIVLVRAAWARYACAEILLARTASDSTVRAVDTVELGRGTWCQAHIEDPGARLNVNTAEAEMLRRLIANDTIVEALLDWRDSDDVSRPLGAEAAWYRARGQPLPRNGPLDDLQELRFVRGVDSARFSALAPFLTTDGTGQVNLTTAPPEVLGTLPGMTPELLRAVVALRAGGGVLRPEPLLGSVSRDAQRELLSRYQDFARAVSYGPTQLVARVEGGVRGRRPTATEKLTLMPAPGRLAIIRRDVE
jgi:general secretion pathway protein K